MADFILGLHGLKRAGKDSFATAFAETMHKLYKTAWHIDSFADPLRKLSFNMFGITEENRHEELEGIGRTGREFQQVVGTEVGRQFHPDTWVRSFIWRTRQYDRIVASDVRFNNEADYIHEQGGMVVHILRPRITQKDAHASESGISTSSIDYSFVNDGTFADWVDKAASFAVNFGRCCDLIGATTPFERDH